MLSHQRNHLVPFICLLLASLLAAVTAQLVPFYCADNGNYTNNRTYQNNLSTLLHYLSANVGESRFYNASVGQSPNRVYGMVLCRVDVQVELCNRCIRNATNNLIRACPNQMQAILWDEFCLLRYSNTSIIGTRDSSPFTYLYNIQNSTRPDEFMSDLGTLLVNISRQASNNNGSLRRRLAYGSTRSVGFQTIYALEECIPNLSAEDCSSCLSSAMRVVAREIDGAIGARILLPSCNLRYEVEQFYNETRLQELLPMLRPSRLTPGEIGETQNRTGDIEISSTTRTIIIVVVSVVTSASAAIVICKTKEQCMHKPGEERGKSNDDPDFSLLESLQYDFSVISTATYDFSEANKLGQGGFGSVYQGKLPNGQDIAVKRLSKGSGQGDLESLLKKTIFVYNPKLLKKGMKLS